MSGVKEVDACAGKKLYLVYYDEKYRQQGILYTIYALDIFQDSSSNEAIPIPLPDPIITLRKHDYPDGMNFAALDSKIYMLGGIKYSNEKDPCTGQMRSNSEPCLELYIFDTTASRPTVTVGPRFNRPKFNPIIIPLDRKLYVLPRELKPNDADSVMEVLDLEENSWSIVKLPHDMWIWGSSQYAERDDVYTSPYTILCHAVNGSEIILSLRMSCIQQTGVFVYNTKDLEWNLGRAMGQGIYYFPFLGSCLFWNDDDICCPTYSMDGRIRLQDFTLSNCDDKAREISFEIPKPPSYPKPYQEDAMVIEVAPRFIAVVSRCFLRESKQKNHRDWVNIRIDLLRLSFKRTEGSKAQTEFHHVKLTSFTKDGICNARSRFQPTLINQLGCMVDYCFLM